MMKLENPVEWAPPFASSGKAGPTSQKKLQKKELAPKAHGRICPPELRKYGPIPHHGHRSVYASHLRGWESLKGGVWPQWFGLTRSAITHGPP